MAIPLVRTKLHRPRLRPNLVPRSRLIDRLNEGLRWNRKLTLLTAPAGFGKTTLVAEWLKQLDRPFAWLCLDEGDNDPVRFLFGLVAALQSVEPNLGRSVQSVLQSRPLTSDAAALAHEDEPPGTLALITMLINDLTNASTPLVIVLDDYHLISQPAVHQAVQFLLEHQPPELHLVVLTREDPPFALARMRVCTELTEVRERDLRFTETEAAAFLSGTMGLNLPAEAIATLEDRTEGWIAGLQMIALSLEGEDAATAADRIATFGGMHHHVSDYLAEEVLRRQPPAVQDFMCQTAILDRLCAPLCDAVTGRADSQAILVTLERSNLFLIALDDRLKWFRYHHLFRDFLRTRLEPRRQAALHHKAALWHEAHGVIDTAAEHALAAGDLDEAERVISLASGRALQDGQLATVLDWLNALPDERLRANSMLAARKGWVLCLMGQREAAEVFAARAEAGLPAGTPPAHQGELLTLQAYLAGQRGDNAGALRLAQQAIAVLDQANPLQRTFQYAALLSLGHAQRGMGDMQAAIDAFHQVASSAQAYGDDLATMGALEELSWLLLRHGRRAEAAARCRQAIERCERATSGPLPMLAMAYIVLAKMCYEANDLAQANQHVQRGLELCRELMMPPITLRGKLLLSRLLLAAGNSQRATATIEEARQAAAQMGLPRYTRLVETAAADIHLLQGHIALAAQWAETAGLCVADAAATADEAQYLVYARLLIAQGRLDEAGRLLSDLARSVEARERYGSLIDIHILQARVKQALGRQPEALDELRRALSLAAPRGYDRVFLDAGSSIAQLLPWLRPAAPEMVDRLLQSLAAGSRQWAERAASLLDPLSARELEVLRLVAVGLSNREAAQALFVTEETIKKHLSHVYDKLAVKNRTQAIARAKRNGWLA